ncbi:hypothetical protein [Candidatus Palauibacter sp.]|uniref:hypothetical protein n=1 Tax=Candidatus Palauibacter sp. TaxID=3101350 RepID=UPI003AF2A49D
MGQDQIDRGGAFEAEGQTHLGPAVWFFGGLMFVIGLVTSILMLRDFQSDSYLYLAFYSIPANTAISVFPHEPVLIYFGKVADLRLAAAAATAGTIVAAIMDHVVFVPILNLQNIQAYKRKRFYRKAISYFMRWPFATIVVTAFTPIPFFPFKFLAFSIRYPMWKWVTALVVARFPRYYLLALLGATIAVPNWILITSVAVVFGLYLVKAIPAGYKRLKARRQAGM